MSTSETKAPTELTDAQRTVADALLTVRPPVIPGSRVILSRELRRAWFILATAKARELGLDGKAATEFFDRAGVPD